MATVVRVPNATLDDATITVDRNELLRLAVRDAARLGLSLDQAYEHFKSGNAGSGLIWADLSLLLTALVRSA
jgi:hypothetical protein